MTSALKAIVEAMIAELYRQAEAGKPGPWIDAGPLHSSDTFEAVARDVGIDGRVDLEKVARAGLEAIKPAPTEVLRAVFAPSGAPGADLAQHEAIARDWSSSIDAILGEKP